MSAPTPSHLTSKTALRWESARAHSRQKILHAAGGVFAKDGFESATMKRVAEVCGVTKVTVYAHFRDKARLYRAVMDGHLASMPIPTLEMPKEVQLRDRLIGIVRGVRMLALDPSCQAFCQSLMLSELDKLTYMACWTAILKPYREAAVTAFAHVSPNLENGADGEKFLRLILAEQGLPQGLEPVSSSEATIALFARSYGSNSSS